MTRTLRFLDRLLPYTLIFPPAAIVVGVLLVAGQAVASLLPERS